ncbi:DUF6297 family protein [Umezawaea endophytica]|uniref:DUF6297 family protein n=1 Tax=Umezawaea endophytica TaxID=1654476 RepID=A0A9X2VJ32_9PSEU|nr:DUF6297 family protein [Umezawaea endophytica]MCS7477528.1 DUF6297 family protein [Umezawaea endophytica]
MTGRTPVDDRPEPTTTAADLRRALRRYRADPRPLTARLSDLYGQALYVVIVGGLLVSAVNSGLERVATAGPPQAPDLLRWTVLTAALLAVALLCRAAMAVGPVLVSPAARTWLLSSPVDRKRLLAPRFAVLIAAAAVVGAVLGATVSLPSALLGAPIGVLITAALVEAQASRRRTSRARAGITALIGCLAVFTAVLAAVPSLPWPPPVPILLPAGAAFVLATAATWHAHRMLARMTRSALSDGAEVAAVTATATTFLDPALLSGTVVLRQARATGAVRSIRFSGGRRRALLRADLLRHTRHPLGALVFLGLLPVPYLAGHLTAPPVVAVVQLGCLFLVADRFARGLRLVSGSAALRRALGGSDPELRLLHLVLPATTALLWTLATPVVPAGHLALSAVGAVAAVYRGATKPPMAYDSPLLDTPMGTMPIGLIARLLRGPGLLVVVAVVHLSF